MAKRKNRGKKKSYRRMGAASLSVSLKKNEDILMLAGGVLVGGIAKGFVDQTLAKQEQIKINQNMVDGLQLVAGGAGAIMLDGAFLKGMGIGLAAAATLSALRTAGVIKGANLALVPFRPRPIQARTVLNGGNTSMSTVAGAGTYGFPQPPGVGRTFRRKAGAY